MQHSSGSIAVDDSYLKIDPNAPMMKTTLELGGQPRTFHFGAGFLGNCLETLGVGFQELFDLMAKNPYKVVPIMMYESYKFNLWLEDKEPDCSQKDFIRWISSEVDTD